MELARMMELTLIRTLLPLFASSWTSFSVRARAGTQLFPVSAARAESRLERRLSEPNEIIKKKTSLDDFRLDFLEQIEFIIIFKKRSCVSKNLQKNLHHAKKVQKGVYSYLHCVQAVQSAQPSAAGHFSSPQFWVSAVTNLRHWGFLPEHERVLSWLPPPQLAEQALQEDHEPSIDGAAVGFFT